MGICSLLLGIGWGCKSAKQAPEIRPLTIDELQALVTSPTHPVTLVNYWASWCVPCREEMPDLLRLQRTYADSVHLILVSVDFEEDVPEAKKFLETQGVDFVTYVKEGKDEPFIRFMSSQWSGGIPVIAVYNREGNQVAFFEGKITYDTLKAVIDSLLTPSIGG